MSSGSALLYADLAASLVATLAAAGAKQLYCTLDALEVAAAGERPAEPCAVPHRLPHRLGRQHRAGPRHAGHPTGHVDWAAKPVAGPAYRGPCGNACPQPRKFVVGVGDFDQFE